MIRIAFVLSLLLALLIQPVAAQDLQKGLTAYKAGDYTTALNEWTPLAEAGDAYAQHYLGHSYYFALGVPRDYSEASKWFKLAANQGIADAQFYLAVLYVNGWGVPQDFTETAKWYRLAAKQGQSTAQQSLGAMYQFGKGVLQDNVMAHMWYNISSANGDKDAATMRDKLAAMMTSKGIAKAQSMARECMSTNYQKCGY